MNITLVKQGQDEMPARNGGHFA